MKLAGFQKVSFIDFPEKVSCVLFLSGCNFRCGFCHNPDLVYGNVGEGFSEDYVLDYLEQRKGKLDAVCISGGEPLATLDLNFVKKIRSLGYLIKIDTNGSYPEKLQELIENNLVDFVSMDIKASKENYSLVAGTDVDLRKIENSIKLIFDFGNYEFRITVVEKFCDSVEIEEIGKWLFDICDGKPKSFVLQGFKKREKMVDENFLKEPDVSEDYLINLKKSAQDFFEEVLIRI